MSASVGRFSQEIQPNFLLYNQAMGNEIANHFLLNYNLKSKGHTLRLEAYYKDYQNLLTYGNTAQNPINVQNNGYGRAYGLDFFWRSNQLVKNLDFWVTYSWINNKRRFIHYPMEATPPFSTEHNFSIVGKKWVEELKSQISFTYQYASGRPYENPNTKGFMNHASSAFHNMSASWAYLMSQQKILFISVSNFPGFRNEFGYRYATNPDQNGWYRSELIRPNEDRFVFVGFFMTISEDDTKNQLDNL
jgi:hypothetical protein